jgi:hypothetical protein
MHANRLMKQNIDAILRARGQSRKDLAQWCRRSESWISKIMKEERREFPMQYFDRIADFFGIATYQLLQPGVSSVTERRSKLPRRTTPDRRVMPGVAVAGAPPTLTVALEPAEVAAIQRMRLLTESDRKKLDELLKEATRRPRRSALLPSGSTAAGEGSHDAPAITPPTN